MSIKLRHLTPFLIAGAAAAAIAAAPTASASSAPAKCSDKGAASHCQRAGHSSIHVAPPARAEQPCPLGYTQLTPQRVASD